MRSLSHKKLSKCQLQSYSLGNSNGLQKALTNAERLVGYPPTYSSLKYLVEEEPADFLSIAKKLVGSGHPLLSIARDMLSPGRDINLRLGGLWVLLVSKAAGKSSMMIDEEFVHGIHQKQRVLAETCELINTGLCFLLLDSVTLFIYLILLLFSQS